jgi:hypothetical protein
VAKKYAANATSPTKANATAGPRHFQELSAILVTPIRELRYQRGACHDNEHLCALARVSQRNANTDDQAALGGDLLTALGAGLLTSPCVLRWAQVS